jgi:hypothetical protein
VDRWLFRATYVSVVAVGVLRRFGWVVARSGDQAVAMDGVVSPWRGSGTRCSSGLGLGGRVAAGHETPDPDLDITMPPDGGHAQYRSSEMVDRVGDYRCGWEHPQRAGQSVRECRIE